MVPQETLPTVSYSTSIASMVVSVAVSTQYQRVTDTDTSPHPSPFVISVDRWYTDPWCYKLAVCSRLGSLPLECTVDHRANI